MKILIDMNLSPDWVHACQAAGIEAVHWSSIGRGDAPDLEIMEYARRQDWVVLTNDLDYGNHLALAKATFPSVVQLRLYELDPLIIGPWVLPMLKQMDNELHEGILITIKPNRTRTRVLPFRA